MKCPHYEKLSRPEAIFDMGEDCIGADCICWKQAQGVGECDYDANKDLSICSGVEAASVNDNQGAERAEAQ